MKQVIGFLDFWVHTQSMFTLYCSLFSSGHRTGKRQFSFQSQRRVNAKEYSNCCTTVFISQGSKDLSHKGLKILQAMLQQYVNWELPDAQAGVGKGRGTRDQIANFCWIIEKAREFQKNTFCFINYAKVFDCVDHSKLKKFLKRWEYQTTLPASRETCMQIKKQ